MTHYSEEDVRERAVDLGEGWSIASLVLMRRDTAWNPCSTKGPIYGPGLVEFHMHFTGITVYDSLLSEMCVGGDRNPAGVWVPCGQLREDGTTRCADHALKALVS